MDREEFPRIFIGYDSGESLASLICHKSLQQHATCPLVITELNQAALRDCGLYTRARDPLASTEFTYTRFLVPLLCGYAGWALFVDADFLFQSDVAVLWALRDSSKAVQVVQHDYTPTATEKMGGLPQQPYPRKNWSSLILWNCGHPDNRHLTRTVVNREPGAYLHRFQWLRDDQIGALPKTWNWLEPDGVCPTGPPCAIHYTMGVPGIHPGTFHYTAEWETAVES